MSVQVSVTSGAVQVNSVDLIADYETAKVILCDLSEKRVHECCTSSGGSSGSTFTILLAPEGVDFDRGATSVELTVPGEGWNPEPFVSRYWLHIFLWRFVLPARNLWTRGREGK